MRRYDIRTIITILDRLYKRTGITYVYESSSFWDKKKKQPRSKRTLIGKIDPETGEMIPTDGRCRHLSVEGKKQAQQKKEQELIIALAIENSRYWLA